MTLFVAKTYFNEEASSILGVFSKLDLAMGSVEKAYPVSGAIDYLIVEFSLDTMNRDKMKVWEYQGNWVELK